MFGQCHHLVNLVLYLINISCMQLFRTVPTKTNHHPNRYTHGFEIRFEGPPLEELFIPDEHAPENEQSSEIHLGGERERI